MTLTETEPAPRGAGDHTSPPQRASRGAAILRSTIIRRSPLLAVSAVSAVLGALAGLVPFVVVYLLAVELFTEGEPRPARVTALALTAVAGLLGKVVLQALANYVSHVAAYRILAELREALAERLVRMPLGRVRARGSGEIKKVLQDDVEQMELGLSHAIPDIAAALAVPLAGLVAMFVMDWRMALAAVAAVALVPVCGAWAMRRSSGLAGDESATKSRLNSSVVSYLQGIRVIRGFLRDGAAFAGVDEAVRDAERIENAKMARGRVPAVLSAAFVSSSVLFLLPLGVFLVSTGSLDVPALIFFLLIGVGFAQPLLGLTLSLAVLQYQIEAGLRNVAGILDEADLPVPARPRDPSGYALELDEVTFSYGRAGSRQDDVLAGISLTIPENSSVALVGATGGGKSTLLGLLARFYDVTGGAIRFGGVDLREIEPGHLMRMVAFVQQDDYVFDETLLENIRLARPEASDEEVREAGRRARVEEFAGELEEGWHTPLRAGGARLSGGQRQRVSIARALLKDAKVVLLDEATAFLDPENEIAVAEALAELARDRTIVAVAHRLGSVVTYGRIVVLDGGRIAASGQHEELLETDGRYQRLWSDYQASQGWTLSPEREGATAADVAAGPRAVPAGAAPEPLEGGPDHSGPMGPVDHPGERTDPVPGVGTMGGLAQWFALLGVHRRDFWRVGLWRILLEGFFSSAPMIVVLLALLAAIEGELRPVNALLYGLVLLGLFTGRVVTGVSLAARWWPRALRAGSDLRRSVFHQLRRVPLGFFGKVDTGRVATMVVSDLPLVDFINMPAKFTVAVVQPVLAMVVLSLLDWRLALAALAGVPVFLALVWLSDRGQRRAMAAVTETRARTNAALLEFVRGTEVLRAHPDAAQAVRYRELVEDLRRASVRMAVRTSPLTSAATVVLEFGFVALIAVGSALYLGGSVGIATLLVFLVISLNLYRPFQELVELSSYRHLQARIADRIAEVWDAPVLDRPAAPERLEDSSVELGEVRFGYGDTDGATAALNEVSFRARPGEVTALVGPSGAGKSTVANLVARFWDVDAGTVRVGGSDVRQVAPADLMAAIAVVYQDVYLFPDTVRGNLTIGAPHASDAELRAALEAADAWDFVAELSDGLDTPVGEGGHDLSGGQRQRLSIARALLKNSPILLLDEAVAAVDPSTEVRIQRALSRLVAGRTVIVVAHRLNTVRSADRIVVLDGGAVDGAGTHEELLERSPVYRRLWAAHEHASHLR